jgi:hypothetical protein
VAVSATASPTTQAAAGEAAGPLASPNFSLLGIVLSLILF